MPNRQEINTTQITDNANHEGVVMWPSLETAEWVYDAANIGLIAGLVVGIISTILIVWMGNIKEGHLRRNVAETMERAANAEKRAAEANLELAKIKTPRLMNQAQIQSFVERMKEFAGQSVSVGAIPLAFENTSLADQIVRALMAADIRAEFNQGAANVQVGPVKGVVARATTGNEKGEKFAASFAQAMNDMGFKTTAVGGLLESIMDILIDKGRPRNDPANEWVVIVVGDKI